MKHPKLQRIISVAFSVSMLAATAMAGEIPIMKKSTAPGLWASICSFFGF